MTYDELLSAYGEMIGIDDMKVDDAGRIVLAVDEFPIVVQPDNLRTRIALIAEIGAMDPKRHQEIAPILLQYNFVAATNGGAALAANLESGQYHCALSLPLEGLSLSRFTVELSELAAKAKVVQGLLETNSQEAIASAARDSNEPFDRSSFIMI